jgi:hypothetical protein
LEPEGIRQNLEEPMVNVICAIACSILPIWMLWGNDQRPLAVLLGAVTIPLSWLCLLWVDSMTGRPGDPCPGLLVILCYLWTLAASAVFLDPLDRPNVC